MAYTSFIDRLNTYLRENNFSQSYLAEQLGCSKMHISNLLSGRRNPTPNFIKKLSKFSKLSFNYWMHGKDKYNNLDSLNELLDMLISQNKINENGEMDDTTRKLIEIMLDGEIKTKIELKKAQEII